MLAKRGLERRIALTVPTFMMALSRLAESDLIAMTNTRSQRVAESKRDNCYWLAKKLEHSL